MSGSGVVLLLNRDLFLWDLSNRIFKKVSYDDFLIVDGFLMCRRLLGVQGSSLSGSKY